MPRRHKKPITKARKLESTKIKTSISRPLTSLARVAEEDEKSLDAENTHKDAEALNASKLAFPASPSLCVTCLRSGLFHRRFELLERELSVSMEKKLIAHRIFCRACPPRAGSPRIEGRERGSVNVMAKLACQDV